MDVRQHILDVHQTSPVWAQRKDMGEKKHTIPFLVMLLNAFPCVLTYFVDIKWIQPGRK